MFGVKGGRVDTLLGAGAEFKGHIHVEGGIVVDGKVDGNITATERISLGKHGAVRGNLNAPQISIAGKVHGHVVGSARVQLLPGAHVDGDIKAPRLNVADGATFSGKVGMAASVQALPDTESKHRRA